MLVTIFLALRFCLFIICRSNGATHSAIEGLDAQAIIFASEPGISIGVSDEELTGVTANGYRFMPNYTNTTLATAGEGYVLAADGGSFDKNEAGAVAVAFRPYFTKAGNGTRGGADQVERIIFGDGSGSKLHPNGDTSEGIGGTLNIYAVKGHIVVESSLGYTTDVRVVTAAGVTVASFAKSKFKVSLSGTKVPSATGSVDQIGDVRGRMPATRWVNWSL